MDGEIMRCKKCDEWIDGFGRCACSGPPTTRRAAWRLRALSVVLALLFALVAVPAMASDYCAANPSDPICQDLEQWPIIEPDPEPIVGPGPCHSDTPWGCYQYRVFLPEVQR